MTDLLVIRDQLARSPVGEHVERGAVRAFSIDCFCSAIFSDNGSGRCRNWSCRHPACEL